MANSYEIEQGNINRRKALIDAMLGASLQGPQIQQSGTTAANIPSGAALATVLQGYLANRRGKKVEQDEKALAEKYNADLRSGFEKFGKTANGMNFQSGVLKPTPEGDLQTVNVPGDPQKAILDAMASGHPVLQQFGMSQMVEAQKAKLDPKDLLPYVDPKSIPALASTGLAGFKPKPRDLGEVGGVLYDQDLKKVVQLGLPDGLPERFTEGGDLYENNPTTGMARKLDNSTKVVNTTNNNAESAFVREFGGAQGKALSEAVALRPGMLDAVDAATKGQQLLEQGIFTGIAGPLAKTLSKVDVALAGADPEKVARTEEFIAYIGDIVIPRLKDFGGSDTEEEMKYLQAVNAGSISLEPETMTRVLKSVEEKTRRRLQEIDTALEEVRKSGVNVPTISLRSLTPTPERGATTTSDAPKGSSAANPLTMDELMELIRIQTGRK